MTQYRKVTYEVTITLPTHDWDLVESGVLEQALQTQLPTAYPHTVEQTDPVPDPLLNPLL